MKFALSSACPDVVILPEWCIALAKQQARLAAWWGTAPASVEYTTEPGQIDDPQAYDVQVIPVLDQPNDLAYHTVGPNGRPLCLIGWNAVQSQGGTLTGPDGLLSAISHEMAECAIDPDCSATVTGPTGLEPREVCDRLQGSDYEEVGSPGLWLANAYGPEGLTLGDVRALGLDIASDLRPPTATTAFFLTPGGYFQNAETGQLTFGERASPALIERVTRTGPRGRKVTL